MTDRHRKWSLRLDAFVSRARATAAFMKSARMLRFHLLLATIVVPLGSACTESIDGGAACPLLCPGGENQFRDTIVDVVTLDTTVGDFPTSRLLGQLLLANRGDTVQTSVVVRYDVVPTTFRFNGDGDTVAITSIDTAWIHFMLDKSESRGDGPVTIEAFDVDTAASDSVAAVVQSLFRPDRLLGSVVVTPSSAGDSLRVPLDGAKLVSRIQEHSRVRVGLRMSSGGQLVMESLVLGTSLITLNFDPGGDTLYSPIRTLPLTVMDGATTEQQYAYMAYNIIDRMSEPAPIGQLQIGGIPAKRIYMKFDLPRYYLDSATIVRAELLLSQIPTPYGLPGDSARIETLIPAAGNVVTDLRRVLDMATLGYYYGLTPTSTAAVNTGQVVINVLDAVRGWPATPPSVPRALGLSMQNEGISPLDVRFYSVNGAPNAALRPRLRITYLPRSEFSRP